MPHMVSVSRVANAALDLVYPRRCVACGRFGLLLCPRCAAEMEPAYGAPGRCPMCHGAWAGPLNCPRCTHWDALDGGFAAFEMAGPARKAVHALKTVFLARQFKPADATPAARPVVSTDPGAIIEITGCTLQRVTLSREDVNITCDKQLTYADGSSKLLGVTMTADEKSGDGRFTASGKEAVVARDQSTIVLNGDVRLVSVQVRARTEHATFTKGDNTIRGPGPVELTQGRTTVSGVGLIFDRSRRALDSRPGGRSHYA